MYIASADRVMSGHQISDVDVEGVGTPIARVMVSGITPDMVLSDKIARIICLSMNLDGGLDRAIEMLRAEAVRQRA